MKTSGDTAADMNGSKANSYDKEDDKTVQSVVVIGGSKLSGNMNTGGSTIGLKKMPMVRKFSMPQNKEQFSPLFKKKSPIEHNKYKTISSAQDIASIPRE